MTSVESVVSQKLSEIENVFSTLDATILSNNGIVQIRRHLHDLKQKLQSISAVNAKSHGNSAVVDKIAEFKDAEIDAMIDEIDGNSKLSALPNGPAKEIISKPFIGTKYETNYSLQMQFWQQFRQKDPTGDIVEPSKIYIPEKQIIGDPNDHKLFRDYCNLRMDLLYFKEKLPSVYQSMRFHKLSTLTKCGL